MSSLSTAFSNSNNLTYALSVSNANSQATTPTGFTQGGAAVQIYNSGATDVQVVFGVGAQTAVFPTPGSPQAGYTIPSKAVIVVAIPANSDSFAAIGSAAGPSIIYVTRGDGV